MDDRTNERTNCGGKNWRREKLRSWLPNYSICYVCFQNCLVSVCILHCNQNQHSTNKKKLLRDVYISCDVSSLWLSDFDRSLPFSLYSLGRFDISILTTIVYVSVPAANEPSTYDMNKWIWFWKTTTREASLLSVASCD